MGWIAGKSEYEVLWFPDRRLEAMKILELKDVIYSVKNGKQETMCKEGEAAGSVGQSRPIYAICISSKSHEIYYRVWLKNIGWTAYHKNGEWCGNLSEKGDCIIGGIQFFFMESEVELQEKYQKAEAYLRGYRKQMDQLFVHNSEHMLDKMVSSYVIKPKKEVEIVENGFVLPLIKMDSVLDGSYCGGIADSGHEFVAGLERVRGKRENLSCMGGYDFSEKDVETIDETVIFGGVILKPFGHLLAESLSRFWYVLNNVRDKVVVLCIPGQEDFLFDYFELMGVEKNRIKLITKLTKFTRIIVPAQSICFHSDYTEKYITIYDAIRNNVEPAQYEKIYLSRADFDRNDGINEKYLADFYERRGYKIISPEKYSIREQVSLMAGAKKVACTEGTLSHQALFCAPYTEITIFRRVEDCILMPQILINQARQLDVTYVDATFNFLPTQHAGGTFLYGPTKYFVEYLKQSGIEYTEEEIAFDPSDYAGAYLELWMKRNNIKKHFSLVSGRDMFDLLYSLNRVFNGSEISRNEYQTTIRNNIQKLEKENKRLKEENMELRIKIDALTKAE